MLTQTLRLKTAVAICLVMVLCSAEAFAYGGGPHGGHYYYRGGRWYRHGWLGLDVAVTALTIGALVDSLPPRHRTVVVSGAPYYYYDGIYYRPCPGGYVVVPTPVVGQPVIVQEAVPAAVMPVTAPPAQPVVQSPEIVTINIPSSTGGYTAVTLKKAGNGYIGPQGEYYSGHPTVEQLKALYGK